MAIPLSFVVDVVAQRGYGDLEKLVDLLPPKSDYDRHVILPAHDGAAFAVGVWLERPGSACKISHLHQKTRMLALN